MRLFSSLRFWALILFGPFVLAWFVMTVIYALDPVYIDHGEPCVVITAQQWMHGRPLYQPSDSPYLYTLYDGPCVYLGLSAMLSLCSDPILASKLAGGFWSLATMSLLLTIFWRIGGPQIALISMGVVASELMLDYLVPFWDRPDPILIFSVALGLVALLVKDRRLGAGILVLAIGLAVDSKIHGLLYLLPTLVIWYRRQGWRMSLLTVCLGLLLALVPFLLPGISLENYIYWIRASTNQRRTMEIFYENLETLLEMILPLVFFFGHPRFKLAARPFTEETVLFYSLVVAGVLVCIPASKLGSGWHHLLPLAVYIGYLFAVLLTSWPDQLKFRWAMAVILLCAFFSYKKTINNVSYVIWYLNNMQGEALQVDLCQLLQFYPAAQMQMGVGNGRSYTGTFYSPWIYREGTPCVASISILMDMKEAGLNTDALKTSLEKEEFAYWVIPQGGAPFSMDSWYDYKPLFDDSVRQTFAQHYAKVNSSYFYDIYQARHRAP